eukprot:1879124-Prymnesium_polylepis.1
MIDDARHALGLPLLVDVDPGAVRTFLASSASRSAARTSPVVLMGEPVDEPVRTADAPQRDEADAHNAEALRSDPAGGELPPDAVVEVQNADARRPGSAGDEFPPDAIVDVH